MHGTYTHRITCNLYPDQHYKIAHAARGFDQRVAPFLRDIALAYLDKRMLLPPALEQKLSGMVQEIRRVGTNLNQIATRATSYKRITHDDLKKAGQLVTTLERQVLMLRHALEALPKSSSISPSADVDQVDGA